VVLSLRTDQHGSEISISDNGKGFDKSSGAADGHFGLRILQDTIREAGGALEILSVRGTGTTVTARLGSRLAAAR
jgi:signal transduction histidine kinase